MKNIDIDISDTKRILIRESENQVTIYYQEIEREHNQVDTKDKLVIRK